MSDIQPQIDRNVVLDMKPLAFETHPGAYAGTTTHSRVWIDELSIFGFKCAKVFYATEGGTEASKIKDNGVTAAGIVSKFSLAGPQLSAAASLTLGIPLTKNQWDQLQEKVKNVQKGTASGEDALIKFGKSNELQELKESEKENKWGLMCDVSNLVFTPIDPKRVPDLKDISHNLGIQGGLSVRTDYHLITFDGLMLDAQNCDVSEIQVCHGDPNAKGLYPLLGIDKAASGAA